MIILGIDPGYDRLGVALIEKGQGPEKLIFSDCLTSDNSKCLSERLLEIGNQLEKLLKDYQPDVAATEKLFFTVNRKSAMMVAEARGVISYLCAKQKIPLHEYSPQDIKISVTGYGNANKQQVSEMVPRLIKINKSIKFDDEYDAIAIALTHSALNQFKK